MKIKDLDNYGLVSIQPDDPNPGPAHGYLVIDSDGEHQLRRLLNRRRDARVEIQRQDARMETDVQVSGPYIGVVSNWGQDQKELEMCRLRLRLLKLSKKEVQTRLKLKEASDPLVKEIAEKERIERKRAAQAQYKRSEKGRAAAKARYEAKKLENKKETQ